MENRVQKYRKAKHLSQRQLADLAGTSQQQIQRIEKGLITTRLETAIRIAQALDKPLNSVFPGAAKALEKVDAEIDSTYEPDEGWKALREAGVEGDPRTWYFKVLMRGHTEPFMFQIPSQEKSRLYTAVQSEHELIGVPFVVFDTDAHRIAINLSELSYCQFLFELEDKPAIDIEESYTVEVFFSGSTTPLTLEVEPEFCDENDLDDVGQCGHIFYMLDMDSEAAFRYRLIDQDGEDAFIRTGDISIFKVPLAVVEPTALVEEEQ